QKMPIARGISMATLPSSDRTRRCSTAVIRREPMLSAWYGRWQMTRKTPKLPPSKCGQDYMLHQRTVVSINTLSAPWPVA
ncbi:hypothetical protein AVEN_224269-1, partial [Araneus ventricosus]